MPMTDTPNEHSENHTNKKGKIIGTVINYYPLCVHALVCGNWPDAKTQEMTWYNDRSLYALYNSGIQLYEDPRYIHFFNNQFSFSGAPARAAEHQRKKIW